MRENIDDRVKERFPLKNGNLIVKKEDDEGVDDYHKGKSVKTRPSQFGSKTLSYSKRLMNDVIKEMVGYYNDTICYIDNDSLHIHKKYWSDMANNGFVGKSLGLGKNDCGISGIFSVWFLAPKINYCL